jgi:hypothetical protein
VNDEVIVRLKELALHGFEETIDEASIRTYVPALNTMCAFGDLFMLSRALSRRQEQCMPEPFLGSPSLVDLPPTHINTSKVVLKCWIVRQKQNGQDLG